MADRSNEVSKGNYINHRVGQWAEYKAAAFLTRRKFEVYFHTGSQSICDLVAIKRKGVRLITHLIEVKFHSLENESNHKHLRPDQKKYGVKLLVVSSDGTITPHFVLER